MLDPLRPYLKVIGTLLLVALVTGSYVTGCSRGVERGKAKNADAVAEAERERDAANEAAEAMLSALDEVNEQAAFNQAEAEKWQRLANLAADAARDAGVARDRAIEEADRAIEEAKRDPGCRVQLEAISCAALH